MKYNFIRYKDLEKIKREYMRKRNNELLLKIIKNSRLATTNEILEWLFGERKYMEDEDNENNRN